MLQKEFILWFKARVQWHCAFKIRKYKNKCHSNSQQIIGFINWLGELEHFEKLKPEFSNLKWYSKRPHKLIVYVKYLDHVAFFMNHDY